MRTFNPETMERAEVHHLLLSGVGPRPIALAGTISESGIRNLSPFSFFNAFSSNPPVVAFSPSYRGTDGTAKDTLINLKASGECTINAVTHSMVEQISLASSNYPPETDEFEKSGLTAFPSHLISAPGVMESPFIMECRLLDHYEVAAGAPGSGNIMICRVLRFHVSESAFEGDRITPQRLDLVARMGYDWYCRAAGTAIFEVAKPRWNGIGIDSLPHHIRTSTILTGNNLARLAGVERIPERDTSFPQCEDSVTPDRVDLELAAGSPMRALTALTRSTLQHTPEQKKQVLHRIAALFLAHNDVERAWQTLYLAE